VLLGKSSVILAGLLAAAYHYRYPAGNMTILYETTKLILESKDEIACLKEKATGMVLFEDCFYGNPECGLIDEFNNWALVAGEHLTVWTPQKIHKFQKRGLAWIHAARMKNSEIIELLIDPWSEFASIWELNIINFKIHKKRDFNEYKSREYTENVIW